MNEYIVIYEQADDGGWGAYLPDVPGVVAVGPGRAEVSQRIEEAVVAYAAETRDQGDSLPRPLHSAGTLSV